MGNTMKKVRKWILLGLGAAFILVGVPILINECCKAGGGYITMWEASDVLSYYGTVVGAVIAVATIAITIPFNRKQIQRDSYLKAETDRWAKIEAEVDDVLDKINPWRILMSGTDGLTASENHYIAAISAYQKYMWNCRIATDKLRALVSMEDYLQIEELVKEIQANTDSLIEISNELRKVYKDMRNLGDRDIMQRAFEVEEKMPGFFSEDELMTYREILENTENLRLSDLQKTAGITGQKLEDIYAGSYRRLLTLKVDTFTAVYAEIQENADQILRFWGKDNADTGMDWERESR